MTSPPDRNLDPPAGEKEVIDRLPPNERGQDEVRTEVTHQLGGSRPLTSEEKTAAERDTGYPSVCTRRPRARAQGTRAGASRRDRAHRYRNARAPGRGRGDLNPTNEAEPPFTRVCDRVAQPTTATPTRRRMRRRRPILGWSGASGTRRQPWLARGGSLAWLLVRSSRRLACGCSCAAGASRTSRSTGCADRRATAAEIRDVCPRRRTCQPLMGLLAAGLRPG